MPTSWYPPGLEIAVDNPGSGELWIHAPTNPPAGDPLVEDDWDTMLYGPELGGWLTLVTDLALGIPTGPDRLRLVDDWGYPVQLPAFITARVAREILPALQRAVVEATAGTDRFERTFRTADVPPADPLCVICGKGSPYASQALTLSRYCDQHGHRPYGYPAVTGWATAQDSYWERRTSWDRLHTPAPATG